MATFKLLKSLLLLPTLKVLPPVCAVSILLLWLLVVSGSGPPTNILQLTRKVSVRNLTTVIESVN